MKFLLTLTFVLYFSLMSAQEHAWVFFKDKPDAALFFQAPHLMLTQKALDRRTNQGIDVNEQDVPLCPDYVGQVSSSTGIIIKARSKWLNALHVEGSEANINNLLTLSFVQSVEFANKNIQNSIPAIIPSEHKISKINKLNTQLTYNYGSANNQTTMLGVDVFHNAGYDGYGMQIAIIDAGFYGVNTASAFGHLVDGNTENGEVLGGYDYVNNSSNYYVNTGSTHGTQVLSTIGAIKTNEFIGTAPKASFYLFTTEDVNNESPLEESLWVQAAEKADSLGVDIINTSLGYSEFDDSKYNYTYSDMDGQTTYITRGANIASQKGVLIVNSAGNSGGDSWKYITAPADANNILAVGAVNSNESVTYFSSYGPTNDGRVKPETLAQGGSVYVVDENNTVKTSNGTSFSGPIISGVAACLWQAYPSKTSLEIRQMIIENSENYLSSTPQGGYGILRVNNLLPTLSTKLVDNTPFVLTNYNSDVIDFVITNKLTYKLQVKVYSTTGAVLIDKEITRLNSRVDLTSFSNGIYLLRYNYGNTRENLYLVKNN